MKANMLFDGKRCLYCAATVRAKGDGDLTGLDSAVIKPGRSGRHRPQNGPAKAATGGR